MQLKLKSIFPKSELDAIQKPQAIARLKALSTSLERNPITTQILLQWASETSATLEPKDFTDLQPGL